MVTFLDEKRIPSDTITKLQNYLEDEQFDTDSIYLDIEDDIDGNVIGNIAMIMNNATLLKIIRDFIQYNESYVKLYCVVYCV